MSVLWLHITLESDANLGRGDGVAGMVDAEIKHDRMGLPYLSGKTLKGLLVAQCAEVMFGLEQIGGKQLAQWEAAAEELFGRPDHSSSKPGKLRFEDACLPPDIRACVARDFLTLSAEKQGQQRASNLTAVTALRRQTAIDMRTGAPLRNSLRTVRVVMRMTPFLARIEAQGTLDKKEKALLGACICAFRRLGGSRNRGMGAIRAVIYDTPLFDPSTNQPVPAAPITPDWLALFEKEVRV